MSHSKQTHTHWKLAFGVLVLFAVALGRFVVWPAYQRHRAVEEIESVGMIFREPVGPGWLQKFGISFERVVQFTLYRRDIDDMHRDIDNDRAHIADEGLKRIGTLTSLRALDFAESYINSEGLRHISRLPELAWLSLDDTNVNDSGLKHLCGLRNLQELHLSSTDISDDGLKHLKGLKNLQYLSLTDTQVTDDGVKTLQGSLPNCEITW